MDIQKSFTYQFDDPQWITKLGIGALISLVPILNLALIGYSVAIIRNVATSASEALPHWDDLGTKFMDGLMLTLAGLIYTAPVLIALCLPLTTLVASGAIAQNSSLQDVGRSLAGASGVLLACIFLLVLLYLLLLSVIRPVITLMYSRDGTFASCFRLREAFQIVARHPQPFFITWLAVIAAGIAIGLIVGFLNLVFAWIPCLGWLVGAILAIGTAIYLITVDAHLFGQFRSLADVS